MSDDQMAQTSVKTDADEKPATSAVARPTIPQAAPHVLGRIYTLGCLTSRQVLGLHHEYIKVRSMRRILQKLAEAGLLTSTEMMVESSPNVARVSGVDGTRSSFLREHSARSAEKVYELTDEGKRFVADCLEIPGRRVHQLYKRNHARGRMQHSLLRNEFLLEFVGQCRGSGNYVAGDYCAEGGAGPIELDTKTKFSQRNLWPDGVASIFYEGHNAAARSFFIEADTGTQRGAHVREKVEHYAQMYLGDLLAHADGAKLSTEDRALLGRTRSWRPFEVVPEKGRPAPVVFVSYYAQRSQAVSALIKDAATEGSAFDRLSRRMETLGLGSAADLFLVANLQAIRNRGLQRPWYETAGTEVRKDLLGA